MGASSSSLVFEQLYTSLSGADTVDGSVLQSIFAKYDKNKSNTLEGAEVTAFIDDLYEFVHARITPGVASKILTTAIPNPTNDPNLPHQPGCLGPLYGPQHLIPGQCIVNKVPKGSREGQAKFKEELLAAIDKNNDKVIHWKEFSAGVEEVLKDTLVKGEHVQY